MSRVAIAAGGSVLAIALFMTCMPLGTHADAVAQPPGPPDTGAVQPGDGVIGEWWTEERVGRVRFVRHSDGTYRGITTWRKPGVAEEDSPTKDLHNHDLKLRGRSTLGIILISELRFDDGSYTRGRVYNPRDGDTYGFKMKLVDKNTLKIRAYYGISIFGVNQIWTRYFPTDSAPK